MAKLRVFCSGWILYSVNRRECSTLTATSTIPWYEYGYYIAGIVAPIISIVAFVFLWLQFRLAKKAADSAKESAEAAQRQTELLANESRVETETRRVSALPFFNLHFGESQTDTSQRTTYDRVSITNCGNGPAFFVKIFVVDGVPQTPTQFDAVTISGAKTFGFVANKQPFELKMTFNDSFGNEYTQVWEVNGMKTTLLASPRINEDG